MLIPSPISASPAPARQRRDFLALVALLGDEHPAAESEQGRRGDVVGDSTDRCAEAAAEKEADDRHGHLER
jgi:hypothetical protein